MTAVWLLLLLLQNLTGEVFTNSISETITEDTQVFYRRLSLVASKLATIEFLVSYKNGSVCSPPVKACKLVLEFHPICSEAESELTGNCSSNSFHQLLNENLVSVLPSYLQANQQYVHRDTHLDQRESLSCRLENALDKAFVRGKSHERVPAGSDHFLCLTDLSQSVASFPCVRK